MRELEYPFDARLIIRKKKSLKRRLLEEEPKRLKKNIAVLGGSTTNDVVDILELFLLNNGIEPVFYQSEYGRYWEDGVFDNPVLHSFQPDIIYVHTTNRNIAAYPEPSYDKSTVDSMLKEQYKHYETLWSRLQEKYDCPIIQNNFELPYTRLMGNMDAYSCGGGVNFLTRLNIFFYEYASSHENFYINDINYQSADFGLDKWYDPFYWYLYKYAMSLDAIPTLAFNIANIIKSIYGKNKKAIAVDLDNTLWGGIVGDDGVWELSIGNETSRGQIYMEFQQYLKRLQTLGILLNVVSKNEEENAKAGMEHPGMVLKRDDFVSVIANWEPKSVNIVHLADELNLGVDSFVFIDDNPAEREIVRRQVAGVSVPELEKPEKYIRAVDKAGYFEMTAFSADDANRNEMYRKNVQRSILKNKFMDYNDYLKSLEMEAEIKPFCSIYMERIAQLINKSNQFNLTTQRFTQSELEAMSKKVECVTLYGKLKDRFGDNGIVTVVIGMQKGEELDIILWLMSCRVLKRDMEFAMMDTVVDQCIQNRIRRIRGFYYPTAKNVMVKEFYHTQGFKKISEDDAGNTKWLLEVSDYEKRNHVIKIKEN